MILDSSTNYSLRWPTTATTKKKSHGKKKSFHGKKEKPRRIEKCSRQKRKAVSRQNRKKKGNISVVGFW